MANQLEKINTYIVPVLTNYVGLARLIETLALYTPPNYQIIVINNGFHIPKDNETIHLIEDCKKKVQIWIDPYRNLGFGKSMNIGIKLSTTPYVTCANDDVELMYTGWWDEVMALFDADPTLAGFNPHSPCNKNHFGDRCLEYEYKKEYNADDILKIKEFFKNSRWYVGCCTYFTIFKKELFDTIGLFDESFGQGSGEDYDLCVRAARAGKIIAGGSKVIVFHWWGKTKDDMPIEEGGISGYDLIAGGNQNMSRKWGEHIDKDPKGWSVSGTGGPLEPFDKDSGVYKEQGKWYQIRSL